MHATHVMDPVCGMWIDPVTAPATADHARHSYYFCNAACRRAFLADPDRYAGPALEREEGSPGLLPGTKNRQRSCPACGDRVALRDRVQERIGDLTLDEFATMVRSKSRRRLGRPDCRREHSIRLIRSIAAFALDPASAVRYAVLEEELTLEIARLRTDGLNRAQVRSELYHLACAAGETITDCGMPPEQIVPMIESINSGLGVLLEPAGQAAEVVG